MVTYITYQYMTYLLDNDANGNSAGDHDGKINLCDEGATNLYNAVVHICRHTRRQERTSPHTLLNFLSQHYISEPCLIASHQAA